MSHDSDCVRPETANLSRSFGRGAAMSAQPVEGERSVERSLR